MRGKRRLLVVQAAALGHEFLRQHRGEDLAGLPVRPMQSVFPALTCTVQASFRTGTLPGQHGMIANGLFHRSLGRPLFWEQSAMQVEGARTWDGLRDRGGKVAMLFWQQSLGESVDLVLSPAPIHKHHGGMIADCYARPSGLYERLVRALGRPFSLAHYWGPFASERSSQWIADATCHVLVQPDLAPDLCLTYLPALDYDLQRFGMDHPRSLRALSAFVGQVRQLTQAAETAGYDVLVYGDYAMAAVDKGAVFPNFVLKQHGLLACRSVRGMLYPDTLNSRAFAVADHEIAHVYVADRGDVESVAACLAEVQGIGRILDRDAQGREGLDHPHSGELVLVAEEGYWLAYPWWERSREEPDYARHVDIHNKPGYDPCELFHGWPPGSVSRNTQRVRGSHGVAGQGRRIAAASTLSLEGVENIVELGTFVGRRVGENGKDGTTGA